MSTRELKKNIINLLDDVPQSALSATWKYLSAVRGMTDKELKFFHNFQLILQEDGSLLARLADNTE